MRGLSLILIVLALGGVYPSALRDCTGEICKPHIIGGVQADIKDFKYQVSLWKNGVKIPSLRHVCGASILSSSHVLTAAHCLEPPLLPNLYYVRANSTTLKDGQEYFVDRYMIHPKYKKPNAAVAEYDVAVLHIEKPFVFNEVTNSKTIQLVEENEEPENGIDAVVAGWGKIGNNGNEMISEHLLKVDLKTVSREECQKCYKNSSKLTITSTHICAGGHGKDSSLGDSGGALVNTKLGRQVGIVSGGSRSSGCPGIYTNLANKEISDFIRKEMKKIV